MSLSHLKNKENPNYQPKTLLMDELTPGIYEIVFTNLLGGVLMRYRIGDLLNFISLEDEEIGCKIPQFRFYSRGDDLIDISNMVRFNEKDIWLSLEESRLRYADWTACKEIKDGKSIVHLYVEYQPGETMTVEMIEESVEKSLKKMHPDFEGMEEILGKDNLKVTRLPDGAFSHYMEAAKAAGADLAHLKPPHMQPKDHILARLTNLE